MSEFYRVEGEERSDTTCKCPECLMWTIVFDDGEPTEIGTSWQGEAGKEAAEDVCDLMNMAYDAGQESRQSTITSLCDRIDRINNLTRPRPLPDPYEALRSIEEWSSGYAKVPASQSSAAEITMAIDNDPHIHPDIAAIIFESARQSRETVEDVFRDYLRLHRAMCAIAFNAKDMVDVKYIVEQCYAGKDVGDNPSLPSTVTPHQEKT